MEFKDFLTELVKKEMEVLGKDKVTPFLAKCGIHLDSSGKVIAAPPGDKISVTLKFISELCTVNPLAKVPARMVCSAYRKFDPEFKITL